MTPGPITEDDLNGYVDDALPPERRAEVVRHLEANPDAAARVAAFRADRDMLRAALAPIAVEPLPPELDLARIAAGRPRAAHRSRWPAAAAAAVLLIGCGFSGGWLMRGMGAAPGEGLSALGQEAVMSYAVYAPDRTRPVEIGADDRTALAAWASNRLGRPVAIPDLAAAGYRFMGGRIVATEHGPAALFMYDDDKGARLVVLARPMAMDGDTPMTTAKADNGVNGYIWSDDGLGYSLVGDAAPDALHPLANEARRQIRSDA